MREFRKDDHVRPLPASGADSLLARGEIGLDVTEARGNLRQRDAKEEMVSAVALRLDAAEGRSFGRGDQRRGA